MSEERGRRYLESSCGGGCYTCNNIQDISDGYYIPESFEIVKHHDEHDYNRFEYCIAFSGELIAYDIKYCPMCGTKLADR